MSEKKGKYKRLNVQLNERSEQNNSFSLILKFIANEMIQEKSENINQNIRKIYFVIQIYFF